MSKRTLIFNTWPPVMKVTGDYIKTLLELETTDTIKRKLSSWGIDYASGYVKTEDILSAIDSEKSSKLDTYKGKALGSEKL